MNKTRQTIIKWLAIICVVTYFLLYYGSVDILVLKKETYNIYFFLFLLLALCNRLFNAYRIKQIALILTKSSSLNLNSSFRIILFSEFVSVLIPTTYSAEAVRLIKLTKYGLTLKQSSLAIIIDRATGLFFISVMTFIAFFLSDTVIILGEIVDLEITSIISALLISVGIILTAVIYYWREQLLKHFDVFINLFKLKDVLGLMTTSLLIYVLAISSYYYAFIASSSEVTAVDVIFIVFLSYIARLVPFSVLGMSAGELVLVIVAGYFGVTHEQALATVMIIILGKYLFSIFGFLLELYCDGIDVVRKSFSRMK